MASISARFDIPGVFPPLLRLGAFVIFFPASLGLPVLGRPCRAAELVCVRAMAAKYR